MPQPQSPERRFGRGSAWRFFLLTVVDALGYACAPIASMFRVLLHCAFHRGNIMRIAAFLGVLILSASAQAQQVGSLISGPVVVVDGDSFDIRRKRIRIWGIDAPEGWHGCVRGGMKWWPAGDATAALRDCLQTSTVTCRVQKVQRWARARYVSECWRDDTKEDIGACMVSSGWARDYPGYSGGHYASLEAAPKAAKRGLWQCEDRTPTVRWCNRGAGSPCERPIYTPRGPE